MGTEGEGEDSSKLGSLITKGSLVGSGPFTHTHHTLLTCSPRAPPPAPNCSPSEAAQTCHPQGSLAFSLAFSELFTCSVLKSLRPYFPKGPLKSLSQLPKPSSLPSGVPRPRKVVEWVA